MNSTKIDNTPFKLLLYKRLTESGWCDQIRMLVRLKLNENENLSLKELIENTLPNAEDLVPASIKCEMLQRLKDEISEEKGDHRIDSCAS